MYLTLFFKQTCLGRFLNSNYIQVLSNFIQFCHKFYKSFKHNFKKQFFFFGILNFKYSKE
jgi:hypothetical protein